MNCKRRNRNKWQSPTVPGVWAVRCCVRCGARAEDRCCGHVSRGARRLSTVNPRRQVASLLHSSAPGGRNRWSLRGATRSGLPQTPVESWDCMARESEANIEVGLSREGEPGDRRRAGSWSTGGSGHRYWWRQPEHSKHCLSRARERRYTLRGSLIPSPSGKWLSLSLRPHPWEWRGAEAKPTLGGASRLPLAAPPFSFSMLLGKPQ